MKYLKTFENHSVNEEFDKFDLNRWVASAAAVFSTALNGILLKWQKIPGIWKNVKEYKIFMNVLKHLKNEVELQEHKPSEGEWIDLLKSEFPEAQIKYSHIASGPNIQDLMMTYNVLSYGGDLHGDIKKSISFIDGIDDEKKAHLKDVKSMLESLSSILDSRDSLKKQVLIKDL